MYSPSRAESSESGFSRYDVSVPSSSASSLSGGKREADRQAFQRGGCLGFLQVILLKAIRAHGVMTGEGIQGGVGSVIGGCAGGQAGVPNLAANGQNPNVCGARNLENDPGVHGMELRMNKPMAVGHLMVVVMPVVNSLDFRMVLDLEG